MSEQNSGGNNIYTQNNTCLIISYYFPPGGGVGVIRPLKISKYLSRYNWTPVILTSIVPDGVPYDSSLAKSLLRDLIIFRVDKIFNTDFIYKHNKNIFQKALSYLLIPDSAILWAIRAIQVGRQIIKKHKPKIVFSTAPQYSNHIVGFVLSKFYKIPLVLDFRDSWLSDPDRTNSLSFTIRRNTIEYFLEWIVLKYSSHIITISPGIKYSIMNRYKNIQNRDISVVYNGYDDDDWPKRPIQNKIFSICYIGDLNKPFRFPKSLFDALKLLTNEKKRLIELDILGKYTNAHTQYITSLGLSHIVKFRGYINHSSCIEYQSKASINIFYYDNPDNQNRNQMISGKLFEQIGAKKPILAITQMDVGAVKIIREYKLGWVIEPDNITEIANRLDNIIQDHLFGKLYNNEAIEKYSYKYTITKRITNIFNKLV